MRIPPPLLALVAALAQRAVSRGSRPMTMFRGVLTVLTAGGSVALPMTAVKQLERAGTTIDPTHPEKASALVTTGPYAITRNPMYAGLTGLLLSNAVRKGSLASLLPVAAFVAVMDRVQIPSEEAALVQRFGRAYDEYRAAVPRWLDRRSLDLGGL
jgi:protein-S-isoprenylcysteine O-methyltransferase Ste14